ncbi:hypothetical protein CIB95_03475 [Lottiidibacillus patelloidae]|uniref:Uncharacterized protein n=1 Tax=Lottiidibacillus patelloidae TaxID=2670334 RepID=A0A263BY00_9BACI|nr:permease prefix domain 1-containing protein [Lottiidibacillus patelloidae]OZM58641.1 hypothetical protein CIB95_03475 [Lottiidibacillus patelloidae]
MKQVNEFVDYIYADVNEKDATDLKEEMRVHLMESIAELQAEGKSEQEAIHIAFERFGDKKQITRGLFSLFKIHNNLILNIFKASILSLIIGITTLLGLIWTENNFENNFERIDQAARNVSQIMEDSNFSDEKKSQILSMVEGIKEIESFALYFNPTPSIATPKKEIKDKWETAIEYGDLSSSKNNSKSGLIIEKDPYEAYYFELTYKKGFQVDKLYSIPFGFLVVFILLGLTSFFIKINANRKMLNALLK